MHHVLFVNASERLATLSSAARAWVTRSRDVCPIDAPLPPIKLLETDTTAFGRTRNATLPRVVHLLESERRSRLQRSSAIRWADSVEDTMDERTRSANCACGQLSAVCVGEPVSVSACHCLECQRRTGSSFGIAAFFQRARVQLQGVSTCYERRSDSGFQVSFHFCPQCGSTVYWYPARKQDVVAVAVGAFADPEFPAPTKSVSEEHRHLWLKSPV